MTLDVVVPLHAKDVALLPWCLRGIRRHIRHRNIYVVAAAPLAAAVRRDRRAIFVDEDAVVPGISAATFDEGVWPWYFQQILKLGMAARLDGDHYLTVDADTVFVRDVDMLDGSRALYDYRPDPVATYRSAFERLTGLKAETGYSFVTHHMVFARSIVLEMIGSFVGRGTWVDQIVEVARDGWPTFMLWTFSEFETYGNYLACRHPQRMRLRLLRSFEDPTMPRRRSLWRLAWRYHYVSFHHYLRTDAGRQAS